MRMDGRWRERAFILLLYLPVVVFNGAQFPGGADEASSVPTGFVQYDQPYYMANARQYVDGATNGLLYASPFSALQDPPVIYFQPQTLALGWLWRLTGADPGLLFLLFGTVFGLLCVHACLKLLRTVLADQQTHFHMLAILFVWGGGLLLLTGLGYGLVQGEGMGTALDNAFRFDPAGGWWFLNLGRNLVYPFEAYYHFLFFSIILSLIHGRWTTASLLALVLAASHPFTGVATLLLLLAWSVLERFTKRALTRVPAWLPVVIAAELGLTMFYYGPLLNSDPEHAALAEQWRIAWTEDGITMLAAYTLVGAFAFAGLRKFDVLRSFFRAPNNRLLAIWALTWFALENHEIFMEPVQPLHFTRGYTWSALFLIGAPALAGLLAGLRRKAGAASGMFATWALVIVMLLDNGAWMFKHTVENRRGAGSCVGVTDDQRTLFNWMNGSLPKNTLLVCEDPMTAYLALVYTPHRAYCSHIFNTPHVKERRNALGEYFTGRITDPLLEQELVVVVSEREQQFVFAGRGRKLFSSGDLAVYSMAAVR